MYNLRYLLHYSWKVIPYSPHIEYYALFTYIPLHQIFSFSVVQHQSVDSDVSTREGCAAEVACYVLLCVSESSKCCLLLAKTYSSCPEKQTIEMSSMERLQDYQKCIVCTPLTLAGGQNFSEICQARGQKKSQKSWGGTPSWGQNFYHCDQ